MYVTSNKKSARARKQTPKQSVSKKVSGPAPILSGKRTRPDEGTYKEPTEVEVTKTIEPNISRSDVTKVSEVSMEVSEVGEPLKKKRKVRKETLRAFVETIKKEEQPPNPDKPGTLYNDHVICLCGCLNKSETDHFKYSAPSTGQIERHMKLNHPILLSLWLKCNDLEGDYKTVYQSRDALHETAKKKIEKTKAQAKKFFNKAVTGYMSNQVKANLVLLIWSICNDVSRYSLNDSILDKYHILLGKNSSHKSLDF